MSSISRRIWTRLCKEKPRAENRTVYVGNKIPHDVEVTVPEVYPKNRIISSRYTAWNFLPKNLFEQFRRIANFYFLVIGVVQLTIDTPVSPATSIVPLVFVVSVTAIKQGYEDWLRHKADREVNYRDVDVVRDGKLETVKSMHIRVGDIVKVRVNHSFPCDLIMLSSANPDGTCYITTANLDGETNLKTHCCITDTKQYTTPEEFSKLTALIECQQPIADLYQFIGNMTVIQNSGEHIVRPLGPENVLLRGARLRNTPYVYGCAIYTGQETKMALNSKAKSTKFSQVEKRMNTFLIIFLVVLLVLSAVSLGMKHWYVRRPNIGQPWYVPEVFKDAETSPKRIFEDFLAFVVLYNYVIPISLYVTVELQKFAGSMFFDWDLHMYDPISDEKAKANTSDLNEELGQVEYLFSDKTGTLTENEMNFRMCSINGTKYEEVGSMLCTVNASGEPSDPVPVFSDEVETFFEVLVLCHSVRVDHPEAASLGASTMYSHGGMGYEYQAPSPDEKAFVEACRRYGVVFHGTHDNKLEVTFKGTMRRYTLLHMLEFDPTRKRMSVIVQNEQGEISLLCKGAESALVDRLVDGPINTTYMHVDDFAVLGLRTLVIAKRKLTMAEYTVIDKELSDARKSLADRDKKLAIAFDHIERELTLLGATAVEDKLQEGVPKTIRAMIQAGIKVWVLTGDKEETAVNISHSTGHFQRDWTELRVTSQKSSLECAEIIRKHALVVDNPTRQSESFALVIDGGSLAYCLGEHSEILCDLCLKCSAVLCCRMTPLQKAEVVRLIKNSKGNPVTAAIGDGANDVSMIQEAHVGIGIMGKEGRQAVRNSDYAFAKFQFLMRALLVHGHFYYIRISNLVQYFFYKNVAFVTAQLFYMFFNAFSAQSLYESWYLMNYNMVFTALPILLYGIFEQHIKPDILIRNPRLYRKISKNKNMSFPYFILWNGAGIWHCVVFFFGSIFLIGEETAIFSKGQMIGNWSLGTIIYFGIIATVSIKLGLITYYWSIAMWIGFLFTAVTFIVGTLVYNVIIWPSWLMDHTDLLYDFNTMMSTITFWLAQIVLITMALLPDLIFKTWHDSQLYGEIAKQLHDRKNGQDRLTVNFTKTKGKLTISQINIIEADEIEIGSQKVRNKKTPRKKRKDSSLIPLRKVSTDETTKPVFPDLPPKSSLQMSSKPSTKLKGKEFTYKVQKVMQDSA